MIISEKVTNLFTTLKKSYTDIEFLQELDSNGVDSLYLAMYSNKTLNTFATMESVEKLAFVVYSYYKTKWNEMYKYNLKIYEGIQNGNVKTTTETIGEDNYTQTNKLASYDTNELTTDNSTDYVKQEKTNTTVSKSSNTDSFKAKYSWLTSYNFLDSIFTDVNTLLTLDIYE